MSHTTAVARIEAERRSTNVRAAPMMAHLIDALERGEDIGHYGRLTVAIVARHFLPEDELIRLLSRNPDHGEREAREMLASVIAHNYLPPTPETIRSWQAHQSFPICPAHDTPDACNVYRALRFPEAVYHQLEAYHAAAQPGTTTSDNLQTAITSEARARLQYTAFAMQAMQEGYPEIAQLFLEAAGAETIHGISHLRVAGGIHTTRENLDESANRENDEIDEMYPRFIRQAEAEGRPDAAASFRLAVERERHHREMFRVASQSFAPGVRAATGDGQPA